MTQIWEALAPVAIFPLIKLHSAITSMSPHRLTSSCHSCIPFCHSLIETVVLIPVVRQCQSFTADLLVLQQCEENEGVEYMVTSEIVAKS
jgi:hypothetical protein